MTFFLIKNMGPVWAWLSELWNTIFNGIGWAEPIFDFLKSFINVFRDLFYFTF